MFQTLTYQKNNIFNQFLRSFSLGWDGVDCQTDIDECAKDEKKCNNGICQNLRGTYQCFCRPGFGGDHCETDFQECLSNPCENGGTCEDAVNDFICLCPPGFEGM